MDRSSRVMVGSASRVSSAWLNVTDVKASDTIGRSVSLNFLMIGSFISVGRSARLAEMASRRSCVASARSLENSNSTMIWPKPSYALPFTCFTPLIDAICSSIGSRISFSTPSGDAPGYGIATTTTGGETSGNSSVFNFNSANKPNTTSATIETTVMSGFLIAKSEMNIDRTR